MCSTLDKTLKTTMLDKVKKHNKTRSPIRNKDVSNTYEREYETAFSTRDMEIMFNSTENLKTVNMTKKVDGST